MPSPLRRKSLLPTLPPFITFPPCFNGEMICSPKPFPPTPPPTPSPTTTPTFQPTQPPDPTPQDIVIYIGCKNGGGVGVKYAPVNYACFGRGNLPTGFKAKIGPVTKSHPDADCSYWPSSETEISLVRQTVCDWAGGVFVWTSPAFGAGGPLTIFAYKTDMLQADPNVPEIDDVYHFSGSENTTGSCTVNTETGKINFNMNGITKRNSLGSAEYFCSMPFSVNYEGDLPPEPPEPSPIPSSPATPRPSNSPTPLPTSTPTKTPTPTPTESPTPTPTPTPI
jgi:hypothetical protein